MTISEALRKLNPSDDSHWTTDGLPIVAVVASLVEDKDLTREMVTASDPTYCRATAIEEAKDAADKVRNQGPKAKAKKVTSTELAAQLGELGKAREALDLKIRQVSKQYSAMLEQEDRNRERNETSVNILYVRHQAQLRASRAQQIGKVSDLLRGAGIEPPSSAAPIDKAMERRRGFGRERPKTSPETKK